MSGEILGAIKVVAEPVKSLVVDRIIGYLKYIGSYEDNMSNLITELENLCTMKLDIDTQVMGDKEKLWVMTRVTMKWLRKVQELIERADIKKLLKEDDGVATTVVKMMDQSVMEKLFKEDREIFDIVVRVVKKKCNEGLGDGESADVEKDDYKKVAKIAMEVMKDAAEDFKKFMKTDDAAVAAIMQLDDDDKEMAMILSNAEGITRKRIEHNGHDEEELPLLKLDINVQPAGKNIIKEKAGNLRKRLGSLMDFLNDENFKKELGDGARLGLEVMDALTKTGGSEQTEDRAKRHRCCGWCAIRLEGYSHRHDMSQSAESIVKDIKSMVDECPKGPVTRPKRADELKSISNDFMEGLESREELIKMILIALKDDQVNAVGVFGMGGSGKTTLAKEVASKRASNLFDKRLVIQISEAPDIKGIQDQVAEGINLPLDGVHSIAQRARKIYNGLISEKKKILIVLDNMWEKLNLEEVGIPRERSKDFCCKLLITTREEEVCRVMDVQKDNIFKQGMLNDKEAINLFEKQSRKKINSGEYKPVAERLLRKCGGLPLTIVATASALRGKDLSAWCRFSEELEKPIFGQVSSEYRETYSVLETSYKLIETEEKRMFFFLACLSPLDSAISVDYMMRYGIGLDLFQHLNNLSQAMERALEWTDELVSSSLLIKDETSEQLRIHDVVRASVISFDEKVDYMMRYGIGLDLFQHLNNLSQAMERALEWTDELVSSSLLIKDETSEQLRIHDVVRASVISFDEKGKDRLTLVESIPRWMSKEAFEKLKAISLLSGRDFSILGGVKAPMLRILLLKGDLSSKFTPNFFEGMANLKVLSLSNMDFKSGLPESMGHLECLKTLHLHHCVLKDINLIGKLVNLLVLSLRGSTLETLATEIGELCNLRLLDMGGCKGMTSIPANILLSRLSCLEGIYMFDSFDDWADDDGSADNKASINEFNKLSHLSVLEIEVPRPAQLLTLNDNRLVNQLGKFRIHVGGFDANWREYMDKVQGFCYVLGLNDVFENGNKFLRALLSKTDCLQISDRKCVIKNFIPQLDEEGFKDLKYLEVGFCDDAEFIINSDEKSMAFGNLQNLKLSGMNGLTRICEGKAPAGIFCNLRFLTLEGLYRLKYGLPLTCVPLNLVEVSIERCDCLEFIAYEDEYESYEEAGLVKEEQDLVWLPYLKSVQVEYRTSLSSILGQVENMEDVGEADKSFFNSKSKFPSLQILKTSVHEKIATLWSRGCHVSSFQNLKVLVIYESGGLVSLGSPSLFAALVQLEELNISECNELQEFLTEEREENELRESVIVFPLLKRLFIEDLCKLKRFYGGSYKLEFPILKSLIISTTPSLTNFDGSENLTALFSDKIVFPCLEELKVDNVSDKVVRLWNWSSSESESASLNPVPNLQHLTLGNTHGFMSIPPFVSHNLSHLEFVKFSESKTLFSTSTVNKEASWAYSQVQKLGTLSVADSDSLEILFEDEDDAATIRLCGQLTGITLSKIPKLKLIPLHLFRSIRSLTLFKLSWEYVFLADLFIKDREQLQLLENLEIDLCTNMKVVIKDELADGADRAYVFPRLKSLTLSESDFSYFARNGAALHFPSLERLKLNDCSGIHSFGSGPFAAPKLKHVELISCNEMRWFLSGNMHGVQELPSLESVDVYGCIKLVSFSHVPLAAPKLHDVALQTCHKMKWFSAGDPNNDDVLDLPSLEEVSIIDCPHMRSFSSGSVKAPKLSELRVDYKHFPKRANAELQEILASLRYLSSLYNNFIQF